GPAAWQPPWIAKTIVGRRVKRVRIAAVDDQIDSARVIVYIKNLLPRLPAVSGFKDAALFIGREKMAHGRDVNNVRIRRMNHDAGDVMRIAQSHAPPCLRAGG